MTFLDHALTERITAEAREIHFWRTVLTVVAGVLYGLGWVAYKAVAGLWLVLAWCGAAVAMGWQEARPAART